MEQTRRSVIKAGGALGLLALAGAALFKPGRVQAAWNKSAFEAKSAIDAMKALGMANAEESKDIVIRAPDIAENGAVVPVTVSSTMANVDAISIVATGNNQPLTSYYALTAACEPFVSTRIKMGKTSNVIAVVKADGKLYSATKEVKVTIGGCGG